MNKDNSLERVDGETGYYIRNDEKELTKINMKINFSKIIEENETMQLHDHEVEAVIAAFEGSDEKN